MGRSSIILFLCLCSIFAANAQDNSLKYGKVTNDELSMTVYDKDTSAVAVILNEDGKSYFTYDQNYGFRLLLEYTKRVKILKQEGTSYATVNIPYYFKGNSDREYITGLEAIAYNLDNGKMVKTKLDKKYIFDEELNSRYKQLKLSIPDVKVGTVIEFKYKKTYNSIYDLPDWAMQTDIPVINSFYEITIPEYFIYNIDTKGYDHIALKETAENQQFNSGTYSDGSPALVSCTGRKLQFTAKDLPALKDENFVWCLNDFRSGIRFELSGTKLPGSFYKQYSHSWSDIEKALKEDMSFADNLKSSNPYKEEIKALVSNVTDKQEKIKLIYAFIKEHIKWNEHYSFSDSNPKDAAKKGTGNNAQINILLMSALKDAEIESYPILLSLRSNGRLPLTHPSIDKLNTFIVGADVTDSTTVYMDGSALYGGLNILPSNLQVDKAYIFEPNRVEKWVDLTHLTRNEQRFSLYASLDKDGIMTGKITNLFTNQKAYSYKAFFTNTKDSTEHVDELQNVASITVDSLFIIGKEPMSNLVKEQFNFTKKYEVSGDYMYVNPMVFAHIAKNSFTQTDRKLPIEFEYPYIYSASCSIVIPEGYEIVELPKSQRMELNDNQGNCTYQIGQNGIYLQLRYKFEINQTIFPNTEYPSLRDFYGQVVTKNTEMIVLKKKQS